MKCLRSSAWLIAGFAVATATVSPSAVAAEPTSEALSASAQNALAGLLPPAARVDSVFVHEHAVVVRLELPDAYLYGGGVTDESLETLSRRLEFGLSGFPDLREIHIVARDPRDPNRAWRSLPSYLPHFDRRTLIQNGEPPPSRGPQTRRIRAGEVPGALDGKLVFLSQCHGWLDYGTPAFWETQRGLTNGIVEDFLNPEGADQFLIDYLRNAGADVFPLRESDLNTHMVIVDNGDGSAFPQNGSYVESGPGSVFQPSGQRGFSNFQAPYSATANPFDLGGSDRLMTTATTETARVTWTPNIPADGDYNVYVSYSRNGTARASDAHYIVQHTGGQTHLRINQERHGWTWVLLGRFHFAAGSHPQTGSVVLANDSPAEPGATVSADAVRFGGGFGDIQGDSGGGLSGHPRWEEGARSYTQYQGAPATVWEGGDVGARSKYSAYEHFTGEDSIFVSWHSNAFNGGARGTTSYIYSSNPPDGTYDPTEAAAGSVALMNRIHDELINDIRAGWDPTWANRGYRSAYFGEINPAYNDEMPSTLLEVAFHDNVEDSAALKDPRFRRLLARAIYQGIVKYFAQRDAIPVRLLPEPPLAPEVHNSGAGAITVSWLAPTTDAAGLYGDPAQSYRVYLSPDGKGFDEGTVAAGLSSQLTNLEQGQTYFVRVTAVNEGGESFPTETLAVRLPVGNQPKLLLVSGFDRLDASQLVPVPEPDLGGTVLRMFLDRMNRFDYLVEHGQALAPLAYAFDSASNEAVASGRVTLAPAAPGAVIWELGEESSVDESLSTTEQGRLQTYLEAGGRLMITGAELAWDLDHLGSAADKAFYHSVLGSAYAADDAGVYSATGSAASSMAGISAIAFEDGTNGSFNVDFPDVLAPQGSGAACMAYASGAGTGCIQLNTGVFRVLNMGFPFESITSSVKRAEVMAAAMSFLQPPAPPVSATPTRTPTVLGTATRTPTSTSTMSRTSTPSPTRTPTPLALATATGTRTATSTATVTRTPTNTRTVTGTATPTPTRTLTVTPAASSTSTPMRTPSPTRTPSLTRTSSPTRTPSLTATRTNSRTMTPSRTGTRTATPTRTATSSPSVTASPSTSTATPTRTSTPSAPTPSPTATGVAPPPLGTHPIPHLWAGVLGLLLLVGLPLKTRSRRGSRNAPAAHPR